MISGAEQPNSIAFYIQNGERVEVFKHLLEYKFTKACLLSYAAFESLIHLNKVVNLKRSALSHEELER